MTRAALLLALLGFALATAFYAHAGFGTVLSAIGGAGAGIVWASLLHAVPMVLNARAWQLLVGRGAGRSLPLFTWLVWVREAVNGLLPVARVGGELATARIMMRRGVRGPQAGASLVVDVTVSIATQIVFTSVGLAALAARAPGGPLLRTSALALAAAVPLLLVLVLVQWAGAFQILARVAHAVAGRRLAALVGTGRRLDRAMRAVYRRPSRIARCAGWQLAGWAAGAAEVWALLAFLGRPVAPVDALAIEAIVQALSSAAFVVPGALGIQEAGFVAVGAALGLDTTTALALALGRRARDVILFVPALLGWQVVEARVLLGRVPTKEGQQCASVARDGVNTAQAGDCTPSP